MEEIIKSTTEKLKNGTITIDDANKILFDLFNNSMSLPTDEQIRNLARHYSGRNGTCSFNFHGGCNVNPSFRNDVINLVKQCYKR